MTTILGVDPGKRGAFSFIDTDNSTISVLDMPVRSLGANSKRSEVDAEIIGHYVRMNCVEYAFIEDVWSTANDGHVGAFSFGDAYGTVKGVLGALNIPFTRVRPQVWKKTMRVTSDKNEARARAVELIPGAASLFARVKDDGRAEASMIALYGAFDRGYRIKQALRVKTNEETRAQPSRGR